MAITIKGLFRGLKIIAQIFMQREHEIEIGYPTDVRHVSHIGLGAGDSCPSWMNEFRGTEEAAAAAAGAGQGGGASISSAAQSRQTSWASLDFERPVDGALPPADASAADGSAAPAHDATTATPRGGAPKKPATRPKRSRASSPAGSSSWRSTASLAAACSDSGDLHRSSLRVA